MPKGDTLGALAVCFDLTVFLALQKQKREHLTPIQHILFF